MGAVPVRDARLPLAVLRKQQDRTRLSHLAPQPSKGQEVSQNRVSGPPVGVTGSQRISRTATPSRRNPRRDSRDSNELRVSRARGELRGNDPTDNRSNVSSRNGTPPFAEKKNCQHKGEHTRRPQSGQLDRRAETRDDVLAVAAGTDRIGSDSYMT